MHEDKIGGNVAGATCKEQFTQIDAAAGDRGIPIGSDGHAREKNAKDLNSGISRGEHASGP